MMGFLKKRVRVMGQTLASWEKLFQRGDYAALEHRLTAGEAFPAYASGGMTWMAQAVEAQDLKLVALLMDHGHDPLAHQPMQVSALMKALRARWMEGVQRMLTPDVTTDLLCSSDHERQKWLWESLSLLGQHPIVEKLFWPLARSLSKHPAWKPRPMGKMFEGVNVPWPWFQLVSSCPNVPAEALRQLENFFPFPSLERDPPKTWEALLVLMGNADRVMPTHERLLEMTPPQWWVEPLWLLEHHGSQDAGDFMNHVPSLEQQRPGHGRMWLPPKQKTWLGYLVQSQAVEMVKHVIQRLERDYPEGLSAWMQRHQEEALAWACHHGRLDLWQVLMNAGEPSQATPWSMQLAHVMQPARHLEKRWPLMQALLDRGAKPLEPALSGWSAAALVVHWSQEERRQLVTALHEHGCRPEVMDPKGRTLRTWLLSEDPAFMRQWECRCLEESWASSGQDEVKKERRGRF